MPINTPRLFSRKKIAWFKMPPPPEGKRVFEERQFLVETCTDDDLNNPSYLAGLSAVVFTQDPLKPLRIKDCIEAHVQRLLNYDCLAILRPGSRALSNDPSILLNILCKSRIWTAGFSPLETKKFTWQKMKNESNEAIPTLPHARFFREEVSWAIIANTIVDNPPGPAPNAAVSITKDPLTAILDEEAKLLLQRAFWNCADIHLEAMDEGRSGVKVYRAHAELSEGLHGKWPQPYFVKIGDRKKIIAEYNSYVGHVDPYVPFHLGPHLVQERCCLGSTQGIIVGDYVEESESLSDCAPQGRAITAIACLFDRTLLGWYRSAVKEETSISKGFEQDFPEEIKDSRLQRAHDLGATKTLPDLKKLFLQCNSRPILVGPIHGDLHAANIRIRATDAIVIDFLAHKKLPLVYDAACLEASLLVDGFSKDKREISDWMSSISPLYESPILDGTLPHPKPKDPSCWFHACVRQIRRYARQWECGSQQDQYAGALALALLNKAIKDPNTSEPEASRRAAAYVFAENILSQIFGGDLIS